MPILQCSITYTVGSTNFSMLKILVLSIHNDKN
jgi:hypothetical protein